MTKLTTTELFRLSERHGHIYITPKESGGVPALSVCLPSGVCGWTVNGRGLNRREYRNRVGHEIGHCEKGAFYTRLSAPTCRGKCEESARRWQYENMVTRDGLERAVRSGKRTLWELSEYFDLPEYLVAGAIRYFRETRA